MQITAQSLDLSKKKKIGKLHGQPVFRMVTKGGLNLIIENGVKGLIVLSCGPHPAVARMTALRSYPDLVIDELSKSDEGYLVTPELAIYWTEVAGKMNEAMNG